MIPFLKNDALKLLKKYNVDRRVLDHVMAVHDYAMDIASGVDCDKGLVEAGALLHDIGRTRSHGLDHAIIGAAMLRKEGVDERIVNIVERHIGAGLTPAEAEKLGLPPKDYVPKTIEEKIVCHADNLIGNTERVSIQETVKMARQKWFPASVERLIRMHFEVFRPDEVTLDKRCDMAKLDKMLEQFDLLYKVKEEGPLCIISLYGQDSERAAAFIRAQQDT